MRHIVRSLLWLAFLAAPADVAVAWHRAGHQIIAAIAYQRLMPAERARLIALLKSHPRYNEDFAAPMSDELGGTREIDVNDWLLQRASIWPDLTRSFKGDDKETYHRPLWHFINLPCWLTPDDEAALEGTLKEKQNLFTTPPDQPTRDMNVIQTIRLARHVLSQADAGKEDKAVLLAWLIHTVGDVHQPLHAAALYSRGLFPDGDKGGNAIPTDQKANLHSLWDGLPGDKIKFNAVRERAAAILADQPLRMLGEHAADQLDETIWMQESRAHATSTAYDPDEVLTPLREAEASGDRSRSDPLELSEEYLKRAGALARQRLAEAGFRLGRILKQVAAANE